MANVTRIIDYKNRDSYKRFGIKRCSVCAKFKLAKDYGPEKADRCLRCMSTAHSIRFRKISKLYPSLVARAYNLDIVQAAANTDEQVAERVRQYELSQGLEPRDWVKIGREVEGRD